jgi:NADH-quinone oxidoreductase subunit K
MFSQRDALQQATSAPVANYLVLGAVLFAIGSSGFLSRRSPIVMLLSAEVMLLGTLLSLAAHCHLHGAARVPLIIVAVAAAGQPCIALAALWLSLRGQELPLRATVNRLHLLAMAAGLLMLVGALLL